MMKCHVGDHAQYVTEKKEKESKEETEKDENRQEEKPLFFKRLSMNLFEHKRIPGEILESWS